MDAATAGTHLRAVLHHQGAARAPAWGWRRSTASSSRAAATSPSTASSATAPRSRSTCRASSKIALAVNCRGSAPRRCLPGSETILLVEDEDGVRGLTRHILPECGYTVLEARDGARPCGWRQSTGADRSAGDRRGHAPHGRPRTGREADGGLGRRSRSCSCRATPTTPWCATASWKRRCVPPEAVHAGGAGPEGAQDVGPTMIHRSSCALSPGFALHASCGRGMILTATRVTSSPTPSAAA